MRLRNVRGAREALEESDYTINVPEENKGRWHEIFGNDNEIHLEIGTGKGRFIMELASKNPDIKLHWNRKVFKRSCPCIGKAEGNGTA